MDSNNASIDERVLVYYLDEVLKSIYALYCMIILSPARGYVFVAVRFALRFVQYFQRPTTYVLSRTSNPNPVGEECCQNESR